MIRQTLKELPIIKTQKLFGQMTKHAWRGLITQRSPSLGARNCHTKSLSWHFYRPFYFNASFPAKQVSSGLHDRASVKKKMAASGGNA